MILSTFDIDIEDIEIVYEKNYASGGEKGRGSHLNKHSKGYSFTYL